jgi:hypothetical protein
MPELSAEGRKKILDTIREAQADIVALRKTTNAPEGNRGSDLAVRVLVGCHAAISREQDRARIVRMLKTAIDALELVQSDSAWHAVQSGRDKLRAIDEGLRTEMSR